MTDFVLEIAPGWYVDSTGRLLHTPPGPDVPVYQAPTAPFTAKDLRDVKDMLRDFAGILPDFNDSKSREKFASAGLSNTTIAFLAGIGVLAGVSATVVGVAAFALAVAEKLGLLQTGPDPVEGMVKAIAEENSRHVREDEYKRRFSIIQEVQTSMARALNAANTYLDQLKVYGADPAQLQSRLQDMRSFERDIAFPAASKVTNALTWFASFERSEYSASWLPIKGLYLYPEGKPPTPVTLPSPRFDHRLTVPITLYALQSYVTLIKGITPEYRSTGEFRHNLRHLASSTAALASNIREYGLARIIYEPVDFYPDVTLVAPLPQRWLTLALSYEVGAVDLAAYTESFVDTPPASLEELQAIMSGSGTVVRGQLQIGWNPAELFFHLLTPDPWTRTIKVKDPEAAAAAANAISGRAFADLLMASGYYALVHQAALLRHLSTEPDRSETIDGRVVIHNQPHSSEIVEARSVNIPFHEPITARAVRVREVQRARVSIGTQRPGGQTALQYRVLLRTLHLERFGEHILDPDYARCYTTSYEDDPGHPGFKQLKVEFDRSWVIDEKVLAQGPSPTERKEDGGTIVLEAETFDWYVRSAISSLSPHPRERQMAIERAKAGWSTAYAYEPPQTLMSRAVATPSQPSVPLTTVTYGDGKAPIPSSVMDAEVLVLSHRPKLEAWALGDNPDVHGERRWLRKERRTLTWSLAWDHDRLEVLVEGWATERNAAIFVVVEELLISGQWLHTAFLVPLNSQLTYVPSEFFERENAAWDFAKKAVDEINRRFTESVKPKPGQAVSLPPAALSVRPLLPEAATYFEHETPEIVASVLADLRPSQGRVR